jgi:hypothetical protein
MLPQEGGHPLAVGLMVGEVDGAVTRCARIGFEWREDRRVRMWGGKDNALALRSSKVALKDRRTGARVHLNVPRPALGALPWAEFALISGGPKS